ncbi:centrosomal protein 20 isoform X2 [Columba livia]|uniref:centrosomal protein 20 isoform X2 n=1 Tax=Columba livia TaxID=8932 RepID=UPI0031BB54B8
MAAVAELKAVLKDTLEKRGALGEIKARIRAEIFNALDDQSEPRPPLSHENLLINELIREYLEYNKYKYAASVLIAESGQPEVPLDRQFLARELNVIEDVNGKSVVLCQSPSGAEEASSLGCVGHQSLSHRTAWVRTWVCVWHEVRSGASPPRAWSSAGSVSSTSLVWNYFSLLTWWEGRRFPEYPSQSAFADLHKAQPWQTTY